MVPNAVLARPAATLRGLDGWQRHLTAAGFGALSVAALPPIHLIPVLWLCFPALVWLIDGSRSGRGAFAAGWWFGLGHFSAGLYWIAHALLTEPEKYAWMIPFAVLGLAAVLAVFIGIATFAVHRSGIRGPGRVLMLAAAWGFGEWLRTWVFTGFPWNLIATVWMPLPEMLQAASLIGALGLGMVTVAVAAMPAVLGDPGRPGGRVVAVVVAHAVLALIAAGGAWRLEQAGPPMSVADAGGGARLRIVQANIAQAHKWRDDLRRRNLLEHVRMSRAPGFESVDAIIWPETAAPYFLDHQELPRTLVAGAAPPGGFVITGAPRATPRDSERFKVWNSLRVVDGQGNIAATYDKAHLVPFGEYVPFGDILPLQKLTHGGTDFSPGPGRRTLQVAGLPSFSPLICYEAIFPGRVTERERRPHFLLNITNDGWFGLSAGPYQHLAAARMRAVEEGLPLVRAANTGISAVIDAQGRILAALPLGQKGVLDISLPSGVADTTFFARHPSASPLMVMIMLGLSSYLLGRCTTRTS